MALHTSPHDADHVERVRIDCDGLVGIATGDPQSRLHVYGDAVNNASHADYGIAAFENVNKEGLSIGYDADNNYTYLYSREVGVSSRGLRLNESIYIDDLGGNVGIGTDDPSTVLDVSGAYARINGAAAGFAEVLRLQRNGGNYYSVGLDNSRVNFVYNSQTTANSTLTIDGGNTRVGIGSHAPTRNLDVDGDAEVGTNLVVGTALYTNQWIASSSATQYIKNSSAATSVAITNAGNVGIGTDSPSNALDVVGHFSATSKSFLIDHPTKENKKLQYASLEGPENGVYVRGTTDEETIELPEYWSELVHDESITVVLTPIGKKQDLFIIKKSNKLIKIGGVEGSYDYVVYGERKDIDRLEVEPDGN